MSVETCHWYIGFINPVFIPVSIVDSPWHNVLFAAFTEGAEINFEIEDAAEQPLFVITTL